MAIAAGRRRSVRRLTALLLGARSIGNIGPLLEKEVRMPDASRDLLKASLQPRLLTYPRFVRTPGTKYEMTVNFLKHCPVVCLSQSLACSLTNSKFLNLLMD